MSEAEALRQQVRDLQERVRAQDQELREFMRMNQIYSTTLDWYAREDNYDEREVEHRPPGQNVKENLRVPPAVQGDRGQKARSARGLPT